MVLSKKRTIAEATLEFISEHPSVRECLQRGLINHSALAREVCRANNINSVDAVIMASTRYAARLKKLPPRDAALKKILMSAKIVVRSKIVLVAWAKERNLANLQVLHSSIRRRGGEITIVEGHNLITIFTEDEFIDEVKQVIGKRIKLLLRELVKITLLLPEKVTFTPGYAAYMFNLIAARGINMVGDVTSTAEHILIIDEKDLSEALAALKVFSL
jgi:hypothetical protein